MEPIECPVCGREMVYDNIYLYRWECIHGVGLSADSVGLFLGPNHDPNGAKIRAQLASMQQRWHDSHPHTHPMDADPESHLGIANIPNITPVPDWHGKTCGTFAWAVKQIQDGLSVRRADWGKWSYLECRHGVFMYMFKGCRGSRGLQMDDITATDWTACPAFVGNKQD